MELALADSYMENETFDKTWYRHLGLDYKTVEVPNIFCRRKIKARVTPKLHEFVTQFKHARKILVERQEPIGEIFKLQMSVGRIIVFDASSMTSFENAKKIIEINSEDFKGRIGSIRMCP